VSGRYVLFTRVGYDTGDFSKDTTHIRDLSSGTERALDAPHTHMAFWSPDGQQVAGWRHDGSVAVCRAVPGTCQKLTEGLRPVWSHDGQAICFLSTAAGNLFGKAVAHRSRVTPGDQARTHRRLSSVVAQHRCHTRRPDHLLAVRGESARVVEGRSPVRALTRPVAHLNTSFDGVGANAMPGETKRDRRAIKKRRWPPRRR
jgi:hypothetical protein